MLEVKEVIKTYRRSGLFSGKRQLILNNVSFKLPDGECLGIIGESGSGKSTLGRQILGIEKPDSGTILFNGEDVQNKKARRGKISAVFQDYTSSINPHITVAQAIAEPLLYLGNREEKDLDERINTLLCQVELDESYRDRYPHELSGGEAQRVCIARAISTNPEFILLDEAISSLDASVQYQILVLLKKLKEENHLSYLFITHDIQAAVYLCDRLIFFRNGMIEEEIDTEDLFRVQNEYASKLLASVMNL